MASETYEFLKKIAQGEEISRWEYPDKLISYVDYRSNIPKITITFDDDDDFLEIFDIDRDSDDRYAWAKFMGNYYYDDYDSYRYEEDWREGYIIQDFNQTNIEKVETIKVQDRPNWLEMYRDDEDNSDVKIPDDENPFQRITDMLTQELRDRIEDEPGITIEEIQEQIDNEILNNNNNN